MSDASTSAALKALGKDPSLCLSEDGDCFGLSLGDLDLENIPSCSQEVAMEILHQDNDEETIDAECDKFLEETFVLLDDPNDEE